MAAWTQEIYIFFLEAMSPFTMQTYQSIHNFKCYIVKKNINISIQYTYIFVYCVNYTNGGGGANMTTMMKIGK